MPQRTEAGPPIFQADAPIDPLRSRAFATSGLTIRGARCEPPGTKEAVLAIGTVKWFNAQKGYGFIQPDGGGADVFVHISAVERSGIGTLQEGQKISYDEQRDPKRGKSSAENLKRV